MEFKLTIEMIPGSNWGVSLAHLLPQPAWNEIRRDCYKQALYMCEICLLTNTKLHCHEQWEYDDKKRIQFLKALVCLCVDCHDIKHWGRTTALINQGVIPRTRLAELTTHFCTVNQCTPADFLAHKVDSGEMWSKRNRGKPYRVDFGKLDPKLVIEEFNRRHKYGRL